MAVGKRIYLKRHMPDHDVMMQFKNIPASNTCDVMGRNAAMNPRIHLVSQPKEQMAVGPALTVKARGVRETGTEKSRTEVMCTGIHAVSAEAVGVCGEF